MSYEIYVPINDFPDYSISNYGNVKSYKRYKKGKILKTSEDRDGYLHVDLYNETGRKTKKIHQLLAEHFLKDWNPNKLVDHINGIKDDNRLRNLRMVTHSQNSMNRKTHKNNTSGYKGVYWDKQNKKWRVQINIDKYKKKTLGRFKNKEEAIKIRKDAELKHYGEYSNNR